MVSLRPSLFKTCSDVNFTASNARNIKHIYILLKKKIFVYCIILHVFLHSLGDFSIFNAESNKNKEKPLKERVCPNF